MVNWKAMAMAAGLAWAASPGFAAVAVSAARAPEALQVPELSFHFDPMPPILHPYMPGGGEAARRENMIVTRADFKALESYLAKLQKLQDQKPNPDRAASLKTYQGYFDRVQADLGRFEETVPEGQRAADVEEKFVKDDEGNIIMTRTVTFVDGSTETIERKFPQKR